MRLSKLIFLLFLINLSVTSCSEPPIPKPKAFLRLSYNMPDYTLVKTDCPYTFEAPKDATVEFNNKCWATIKYPKLKASIDITYRPVENNLMELLRESEKLTYAHAIKADAISARPFENSTAKKYGILNEVAGNAASAIQFHLTDSTGHFLTGALYFNVQPNYDSIMPAVKYLEKDIVHLMETLQWKQ